MFLVFLDFGHIKESVRERVGVDKGILEEHHGTRGGHISFGLWKGFLNSGCVALSVLWGMGLTWHGDQWAWGSS